MRKVSILLLLLILFSFSCSYNGELVVVNDGNNVYHRDDCQFVKKASNKNVILIGHDLKNTVYAHLRPCKTCNPPDNKEYVIIVVEEIEGEILKLVDKYNTTPEHWTVGTKGLEAMFSSTILAREAILKEIEALIEKINKIFETYNLDRTITIEDFL